MLPIRYWNRIQNIGDAINPYILELVSGQKPYYATNAEEEHVLGVGSIFFMANKKSHIWGSGILDPRHDVSNVDLTKVHAVRGRGTRSALERWGLSKAVALGDPGVFVDEIPEIAEVMARREIKRGAVLIPHYALVGQERTKALASELDATILSPRTSSLDFVKEIVGAEVVVSQSLHGLIFAEALGKPSAWISHSGDEVWTFKFHDWYSNTIEPPKQPLPMDASAKRIRESVRLSGLSLDKEALREAFPSFVASGRPEGVGFRECRQRAPLMVSISSDDNLVNEAVSTSTFRCERGNEEKLRQALNGYGRAFDEPCCLFMTFDPASASQPNKADMPRYLDLLTEFPDIHFFGVLPASEFSAEPLPPKRTHNGLSIYEWDPKFNWRGAVLARNPINFSFAAPGRAVFV